MNDEIRQAMFDINPSAPLGIDERDLEFAHLLILYLLSKPGFDFTPELQEKAVLDHKNAALLEPDIEFLERGEAIIEAMREYFTGNGNEEDILEFEKQKLNGQKVCNSVVNNIYE